MTVSNEQLKQAIEALTGRRMEDKKMGRPANPQKRSEL
jgi:hypothetical protein